MNIILAEELRYPIGSFIETAKKTFPPSSVINCSKRTLTDVIVKVASPPPLTRGWLVFANLKDITEDTVRKLENKANTVIYIVRSKDKLRETAINFDSMGLRYEVVNNLTPSEGKISEYITRELSVDEDIAKYIINRHRKFLPKISETVDILRSVDPITKANIRKYTEASMSVSFDQVFRYVIGQEIIKHNKAVSLIRKYRYGLGFFIKFMVRRFEIYLKIYEDSFAGQVSLENVKEYYNENRDSLKDVSEFVVEKALEAIGVVSYDKLTHLYYLYKEEEGKRVSVLRVLSLLKLSKIKEDIK